MLNSGWPAEIAGLMEQAAQETDPRARVAIYNEAMRAVDAADDDSTGFDLRTRLFSVLHDIGRVDQSIVNFAWCLAKSDADPVRFPITRLLWYYKWILISVTKFPHVPLPRIRAMLADFTERLRRQGDGTRTSVYLRMQVATELGLLDEAAALSNELNHLDRDGWSDCSACERDSMVSVYIALERHQEALEWAEPLLAGRMHCSSVPISTYSDLIYPTLRMGQHAQAARYWAMGCRQAESLPKFAKALAQHIQLAALTHNPEMALDLIERHLTASLETPRLAVRMPMFLGIELTMRRLAGKVIQLRLPAGCEVHDKTGRYSADALLTWAAARLKELEQQFDARNGNDMHSQKSARTRELLDSVPPTPLRGRRQRRKDPDAAG